MPIFTKDGNVCEVQPRNVVKFQVEMEVEGGALVGTAILPIMSMMRYIPSYIQDKLALASTVVWKEDVEDDGAEFRNNGNILTIYDSKMVAASDTVDTRTAENNTEALGCEDDMFYELGDVQENALYRKRTSLHSLDLDSLPYTKQCYPESFVFCTPLLSGRHTANNIGSVIWRGVAQIDGLQRFAYRPHEPLVNLVASSNTRLKCLLEPDMHPVVRVYNLELRRVRGVPKNTTVYIKISVPDKDTCGSTDDCLIKSQTTFVQKLITVESFGATLIRIELWSKGRMGESLLGFAVVNLLNRLLLPDYTEVLHAGTTPTENIQLQLDGKDVAVWYGWIEFIPKTILSAVPPCQLMQPTVVGELRLVIWGTQKVRPNKGQKSVSHFVKVISRDCHGNDVVKETDVHYNSTNGLGRFNYRFKWGITLPSDQTILLQIMEHDIWGGNVISESNPIDLGAYTEQAFVLTQANGTFKTEISVAKCYVIKKSGMKKKGAVLYEMSIVGEDYANRHPVGEAQNLPNESPYLAPVLENRTMIDWEGWSVAIQDITGFLGNKLRWVMYIGLALILAYFFFMTIIMIL